MSSLGTAWTVCAAEWSSGYFILTIASPGQSLNDDLNIVLIPTTASGRVQFVGYTSMTDTGIVGVGTPGETSGTVSGAGTLSSNIADFGPTDLQITLTFDDISYSYQATTTSSPVASTLGGTLRVRIDTTRPSGDDSAQSEAVK